MQEIRDSISIVEWRFFGVFELLLIIFLFFKVGGKFGMVEFVVG